MTDPTTVNVIISGKTYNLTESVNDAELGDLIDLEDASLDRFKTAVTVETIMDTFTRIGRLEEEHMLRLKEIRQIVGEQLKGLGELTEEQLAERTAEVEAQVLQENKFVSAPVKIMSDRDIKLNLIAVVFLAKRKAGEDITFLTATKIPFTSIGVEIVEGSEGGGDDDAPKAPDSATSAGPAS